MKNFDVYQALKSYFPDDLMAFARKTDPVTSKEAAATVNVSSMEQTVLDVIKSYPKGCITEQIELDLPDVRISSISPRIRPLINKGLIIDTGEKRPSSSGRNQRVLKAVV